MEHPAPAAAEVAKVQDEFAPRVRWVIPQRLDQMAFVGRDVVAVAHDVYIVFLNLRSGAEMVYEADSHARGDGVDVFSGHKSPMFAFAEKVKNARIFIVTYPAFVIVAELKDMDVNRYKGLCLMEGELVAAFSGFPDYLVSVWSWRSGQRLLSLPTAVVRRSQIYSASRTHTMVCQCWGEGLIVWEVAPCYRRCFVMRRAKEEETGWAVAAPPLVAVCWDGEGQLYAVDDAARLYSVASDAVRLTTSAEWAAAPAGPRRPSIASLAAGLLLYGPDDRVRLLKKVEPPKGEQPPPRPEAQRWRVAWEQEVPDAVERMVANAAGDAAALWTRGGRVYRVAPAPAEAPPAAAAAAIAATPAAAVAAAAPKGKRGRPAPASPRRRGGRKASEVPAQATLQQSSFTAPPAPAPVDDNLELRLLFYKQRNIRQVRLIAPAFKHVAVLDAEGALGVYEVESARPVRVARVAGGELTLAASPAEPLLAVLGVEPLSRNYGLALLAWETHAGGGALRRVGGQCLTHQHVSRAAFSPTGRELLAAAMSAGHVFLYRVARDHRLTLVRYAELGRGLADCFLMRVGDTMRAFALVLYSDKHLIGERVVCINAETGKDNKFAGKMQGPYRKLLPLSTKDTILGIPHQQRQYHVLRLAGDKGVTVTVRMGPILESGHELRHFGGSRSAGALATFGADGAVLLRPPDGLAEPVLRVAAAHRYEAGVRQALVDDGARVLVALAESRTLSVRLLRASQPRDDVRHEPPDAQLLDPELNAVPFGNPDDKNYLDMQEEKKVREESLDYRAQREEVVQTFNALRSRLVELLEENLAERPLHRLSLSEFNLHLENKKERLRQAEREREEIRLATEARIRAQDKVTAWIKARCWDSMLTPRVKLFAIFSHYQVENYPVLPTQRDQWPELQQAEALRLAEEELGDVFRPWEQAPPPPSRQPSQARPAAGVEGADLVADSQQALALVEPEEEPEGEPYVLSGTGTHRFVAVPPFAIPQTLATSFLQMNWLYHIVKLNVQNMRLWFNKQFDELMAQKRREVGLVCERNARLRFIIEELNKLSDLRGSFHQLIIAIRDPEWAQEEQPIRLTRVEVDECTIPPWRSHISLPPPELGPKDDFRERALNEMMDGVLEKLWHEEIKKPIPIPQVMLDKEPEHFNEEDLRQVFDYEAKVKFRNEEREKYRKMLHAEYAKLTTVLNENIVKFNMRVKDMWLTKLRVDSVIGQENLNLMRLRRVNLDRVEAAELLEDSREQVTRVEAEAEELAQQLAVIEQQSVEVQAAYDALVLKDRQMERAFKNHFADVSPIVFDTCFKFFRKRPKWHQRASMIPVVLYELAGAIAAGVRPPLLHADCLDYYRAVEQQDLLANMPPVMDEALWATMCRLRRAKIEVEVRTRGVVQETASVDAALALWRKALAARRQFLQASATHAQAHREAVLLAAMDRPVQLVLPAGQVEVVTSGHMQDFDDAALVPRDDVETINNLILRVGALKLRMMRRQIEFRKLILAKEWEHAQMKMKLRHMRQELYSYQRLRLPKELQWFLKNKELGYTDEMDIGRLEADMAATRRTIERVLRDSAARAEELEVRGARVAGAARALEELVSALHVRVSEKRLREDPLEPIRVRRELKRRMDTLVQRARLVRAVQAHHSRLALLHTELELLRLRTYPTLATFQTFD